MLKSGGNRISKAENNLKLKKWNVEWHYKTVAEILKQQQPSCNNEGSALMHWVFFEGYWQCS